MHALERLGDLDPVTRHLLDRQRPFRDALSVSFTNGAKKKEAAETAGMTAPHS
jgi:hypothetical protein